MKSDSDGYGTAQTIPRAPRPAEKSLVRPLSAPEEPPSQCDAAARPLRACDVLIQNEADAARCVLPRSAPLPLGVVNLSPREREIARMVAKGLGNKTIAAVLDISVWTVGTHLRRIYTKFGVTSRAAMVAQLLGHDLLK